MTHKHAHCHDEIKYGAFRIVENIGYWNSDTGVAVNMVASPSESCEMEGVWNPHHHPLQTEYRTAVSGLCIWGKYDCVFYFKPKGKGNPGAERSLSNPKDRLDLLRRLHHGQKLEQIVISSQPFGLYQSKMIGWQADTVRRFGVQKLYYALPVEEYSLTLKALEHLLPLHCVEQIAETLQTHHQQLEQKIVAAMGNVVEFIHPIQNDSTLSVEESYVWPYQHLDIELGIEEMEEVRIPYQAMKTGATIPPILLGMLGMPCPYYERREYHDESSYICLVP